MRQVIGYDFAIILEDDRDSRLITRTQLHGIGGAIGNASLHIQDLDSVHRVACKLVSRARLDLGREGCLYSSNDGQHDKPLKVEKILVAEVLSCSPIYSA